MWQFIKQLPLAVLVLCLGVMQYKLHTYEMKEMRETKAENAKLVDLINKQNEYLTAYDDVLQNIQTHKDGPLSPAVDSALDGLRDIEAKRH